jgi:hypothetical protein
MNVTVLAALSIVLIGDSHSDFYGVKGDFGFFGRRLTELFAHMRLYAVSNSKPSSWRENPSTSPGLHGFCWLKIIRWKRLFHTFGKRSS